MRSLCNEGFQVISTSELTHTYCKIDPTADNDTVLADLAMLRGEKLIDFIRRGSDEGAWRLRETQTMKASVLPRPKNRELMGDFANG